MLTSTLRRCLIVALLGLGACGGVRWERQGTDAATLSADTDSCMLQARDRLGRAMAPMGQPRLDPRFGPDVTQPSPADRRIEEQQAADRCMREKGYRLVPVK